MTFLAALDLILVWLYRTDTEPGQFFQWFLFTP